MKKTVSRIFKVILVLTLIAGIGLVAYPTLSHLWNTFQSSQTIASYDNSLNALKDSDYSFFIEKAKEYNEELLEQPDRYHPSDEFHDQYMKTLNLDGSGLMGTLTIPKINVKLPIYHTVEETVLENAAGHIEGTSLPIGGIGTHSAISGHTGLPSARLLTDLDKLKHYDLFTISVMNQKMTYEITDISVVLPEEADLLEIDPDKDQVTLVTCTPYGINTHRLLITGQRVDNPKEDYMESVEKTGTLDWKIVLLGVVGILAVVLFGVALFKGKNQKNKKTNNKESKNQKY